MAVLSWERLFCAILRAYKSSISRHNGVVKKCLKGGLKMRSVEEIKRIKESYLPGMRIRLIKMDDPLSRILDNASYQYF